MRMFRRLLSFIYSSSLFGIVVAVEDFGKPPYLAAGLPNIEIEPPCAKFISSDPLYAKKPITLWCAAKKFKGDTEYLPIDRVRWSKYPSDNASVTEATEVTTDYPSKTAILDNYNATLELGFARATAVGKYRCDLWHEDNYMATGNLFINMRPVVRQENNQMLRISSDDNFSLTADEDPEPAMEDSIVNFTCNAIGYPEPTITWEKNNEPIESDGKHFKITENTLTILRVASNDAAIFKCIASNNFLTPSHREGVTYATTVSFSLKVDSQWTWWPLIIIILLLIALIVLIIFFERRHRSARDTTHRTHEYRPTITSPTTMVEPEAAVFG